MKNPKWITLEIGEFSKEELIALTENDGFFVSDLAKYMMKEAVFTTLSEKKILKLAYYSVAALFDYADDIARELRTYAQLHEIIKLKGGRACPVETGLYLRRALKDQHYDIDSLKIVMDPLNDPHGDPRIFRLYRLEDNKSTLDGTFAFPDDRPQLGDLLVFVVD